MSAPLCGVYVIFAPSGVYIGESQNVLKRRTVTFARRLQLPWTIVKYLPPTLSKTERYRVERLVIDGYGRAGCPVLGQGPGGTPKGRALSAECRAKLSAKLRGRVISVETRARMSAARRGVAHSPAHTNAITAALRRPEVRAKISAGGMGNQNAQRKRV